MFLTTIQKKTCVTISTIFIVILLGAVVVPTLSAFADNGKSQNDNSHKKSLKGDPVTILVVSPTKDPPKDPQRCLHGASAKYNKHC